MRFGRFLEILHACIDSKCSSNLGWIYIFKIYLLNQLESPNELNSDDEVKKSIKELLKYDSSSNSILFNGIVIITSEIPNVSSVFHSSSYHYYYRTDNRNLNKKQNTDIYLPSYISYCNYNVAHLYVQKKVEGDNPRNLSVILDVKIEGGMSGILPDDTSLKSKWEKIKGENILQILKYFYEMMLQLKQLYKLK